MSVPFVDNLTVNGSATLNASTTFLTLNNDNGDYYQLNFANNGGDVWHVGPYYPTNNNFSFYSVGADTELLNIDSNTGMLLINASNTGEKINMYNTGTGYSVGVEAGNFKFVMGNGASDYISFNKGPYSDSTEVMRVQANGNVGIGTIVPNEKLTVAGNISASGSLNVFSLSSRTIDLIHTPANDGVNPVFRIGEYSTTSGNAGFSGMFMSYNETANMFGISAQFAPSVAVPAISIGRNANVGIGTDASSEKLTINGSLSATAGIVCAPSTFIAADTVTDAALIMDFTRGASTGGMYVRRSNGQQRSIFNYQDSAGNIDVGAFSTNINSVTIKAGGSTLTGYINMGTFTTNNAVRIIDNGNFGIGTIVPNQKLTVAGSISASNAIYTSLAVLSSSNTTGGLAPTYLRINNSSGDGNNNGGGIVISQGATTYGKIGSYYDPTLLGWRMSIGAGLTPSIYMVNTTGNVGIGTAAPGSKLTVAGSISAFGTITGDNAVAFSAGTGAISNVALAMPRESALRNSYNGDNAMYFDVSNGGSTHGSFQFRSTSSFTSLLLLKYSGTTFNVDMPITGQSPTISKTAFNAALDTEITVGNFRFRITSSGGIFPQVIGNGGAVNAAWTCIAALDGTVVAQAGSTGTIVSSSVWSTLYNLHGMDAAGDTINCTIQDKAAGRIYRVTFMRSDNGSTTGYNIIGERIL